jgi:hypothetical protein
MEMEILQEQQVQEALVLEVEDLDLQLLLFKT